MQFSTAAIALFGFLTMTVATPCGYSPKINSLRHAKNADMDVVDIFC
jgi:hypothetical protein